MNMIPPGDGRRAIRSLSAAEAWRLLNDARALADDLAANVEKRPEQAVHWTSAAFGASLVVTVIREAVLGRQP